MCIQKEIILSMQPKFILQWKETLEFMNVRCFEICEKPVNFPTGGAFRVCGLWAEGTQDDDKDTFYYLALYTFLFFNLLNVLYV